MRREKAPPPVDAPIDLGVPKLKQVLTEQNKLPGFLVNRVDQLNRSSSLTVRQVGENSLRVEAKLDRILERLGA